MHKNKAILRLLLLVIGVTAGVFSASLAFAEDSKNTPCVIITPEKDGLSCGSFVTVSPNEIVNSGMLTINGEFEFNSVNTKITPPNIVQIKILAPDSNTSVFSGVVFLNSDGTFSLVYEMGGDSYDTEGTYTITATNHGKTVSATVEYSFIPE